MVSAEQPDIDLLVDPSPGNFDRIKAAMLALPDAAIREVQPGDLDQYVANYSKLAGNHYHDLLRP